MLTSAKPEIQNQLRESFKDLLGVKGSLVVGLGNWQTGSCIAYDGINSPLFPNTKIELAVEGNSDVIRAKLNVAKTLNFEDKIEQILIALQTQWHVIRVLSADGYFIYLAMDRNTSSIASASFTLSKVDEKLSPLLAKA